MRTFDVSFPELIFVAATRGLAGAGVGLLISDFVRLRTRKRIGWTLVAIGALTTLPIAASVFSRTHPRQLAD